MKRAKARKIIGYYSAIIRTESLQAVRYGLDKEENQEKTVCNLRKTYKNDAHKGLGKVANALIVQMQIEKIGLRKFFHFGKVPGYYNVPANKTCNLQSTCWSRIIYTLRKKIRCKEKLKKKWYLGR